MRKPILFALALVSVSLFTFFAAPISTSNPTDAARLNNLGVAYMNQQLFEKALHTFDAAIAKDPALKVATLNRGVALLNLQKIDDARESLEKATKDNPSDAHAWFNLGLYYKNSTNADAAIDCFRRVTEIDPADADTWYFLGATYAQEKGFPEAIAAFEHALKLDPLHASAQFGLARAYQQSGQADSAHEAMKKFQYVTQNKLGAPISLSYGEQGKYSRAEESPIAPQKVPPQIDVKFVDVTKEAGLATTVAVGDAQFFQGPGACFLDYDNDGLLDLLVTDYGAQGGVSLYHNLGHGKFEDVTGRAGLDPKSHAIACGSGDYDNDGYVDLALSFLGHVTLLHNEKNGTFKDVSEHLPVKPNGSVRIPAWIDYDHDGDIDLFLGSSAKGEYKGSPVHDELWRNNGDGTFTDVSEEKGVNELGRHLTAIGTDYNNDRAVDVYLPGLDPLILENPREGKFIVRQPWDKDSIQDNTGVAIADFNHDGWMDLATTHFGKGVPALTIWHNDHGKRFTSTLLPKIDLHVAYGIVAFDYDNDGWVDLAAVGETKEGKGEVRLFRNLGPDGWKDVTTDVGLDKIQLNAPRAIIAGDYDNDGAVDLLITQNHGPAVLLRNVGGNKNNWLRLALKGLNDNKSAIGTKVEVFSGGIRQKFEVYGSSGYLGQNSPYLTIGLGQAKQADIVRMLWPTGVLQDEIEIAANKVQNILELDRRGSSCPTLFAWDGTHYGLVGDMLGAGVIGHWISSHNGEIERNIPRPTEAIKLDRSALREKDGKLSFRFMEPLEESVYLDEARLLAVDHPAKLDVYPNEYFASNPPYPEFKVVFSNIKDARPPAGAWTKNKNDEHGHDVLPDLLAHRYFGDFKVLPFLGFAEPHSLELDLGEPYAGGPLWLLMHGEIEYFSANSMYAADQAGLRPVAPYVETLNAKGQWVCIVDDLGFPAGGVRTMTADLTGKLPLGTRRIRLTTNLQIYWDNILISRTDQHQSARLSTVPLVRANLVFHGFPLKIEDQPPGNVKYIYDQTSATGPYTRPAGAYTRYGDVLPLLTATDDKFAVFGSGDEVALDFDPAPLPALPPGWVRDYFFIANGYEKDMDFYAYHGDTVAPLPFGAMKSYPYPNQSFPTDPGHLNYQLEYNTRFMSGNETAGYSFHYPK